MVYKVQRGGYLKPWHSYSLPWMFTFVCKLYFLEILHILGSGEAARGLCVKFLICHRRRAVWKCSVFYSAPNNLFCSARRTHWQMFPALGIYLVECNGCKEFENACRTNSMGSSNTILDWGGNIYRSKTESMRPTGGDGGVCIMTLAYMRVRVRVRVRVCMGFRSAFHNLF